MKQIVDCIAEFEPHQEGFLVANEQIALVKIIPIKIRMYTEEGERAVFHISHYRALQCADFTNNHTWRFEAKIYPDGQKDRQIKINLFYYALSGKWELITADEIDN